MFVNNLILIIVTALITVIFALWKFRSERWLEQKIETYTKVIESLYKINKVACHS